MNIADILSRATVALSAADDQTKASAEKWLSDLIKGKIGIIGETPFLVSNKDESLRVNPIGQTAGTLTDLIEYHQYLKAGLFNEIGLNSNYNMKREAINSNESQLNDDALHPFIDTMLKCRQDAADEINRLFGMDISVEFNSAWLDNEIENEAVIDSIQAEGEQAEEGFIDDSVEDDTSDIEFEEEDSDISPEKEDDNAITEAAESIVEKVEEILEDKEGDDNDIGTDKN